MPEISRFYGMIIKMYFQQKEHNPPHFHVVYGDYIGVFEIETLKMTEGDLPQKAIGLVKEWALQHQGELMNIWNTQNFEHLPPLE